MRSIPSDFKVGNIIPIFKSGKKDVTAPENYRGISLTPLVSKVLERIVFDEVSAFLSNRKLLSKFQFGLRASHSCSDLLLATLDDWLQARDKKQYTCTTAVFIDLSKAFDNVLHEHLLLTLQACGISDTSSSLVQKFSLRSATEGSGQQQVVFFLHVQQGGPPGQCPWTIAV